VGRAPVVRDQAAQIVAAQKGMAPVDRVGVYARMYFDRIVQALAEVYPKLAKVVGDDGFRALVSDYLRARPPAHPMLQRAGSQFPAFVGAHPRSVERPWLAELARLEWARFFAVDAPDSAPLRESQLRALDGAAVARLPLRLIAAHSIVESEHAVDGLWRAIHDNVPSPRAPRRCASPRSILVWRRDVVVMHRPLRSFEARIARLAQRGATFGDACELAFRERRSIAAASRWVFETVGRFVSEEVIAAPRSIDLASLSSTPTNVRTRSSA
jgi:hypothetical protein